MAWSTNQQYRLAFEKQLLARKMPHFQFYNPTGDTHVTGWARTSSGNSYQGKLVLPPDYPYDEPELFIASPRILWKHGHRGTINNEGTSHAFHTYSNERDGCVQVCHTMDWDSSKTCVLVLVKMHLWLEAYEAHLKTGRDIADYLC